MKRALSEALALLLAFCLSPAASAMAPIDEHEPEMEPFNQVVSDQTTAFRAGEFDKALALNDKLLELASGLAAEKTGMMGMILYDRAVIRLRQGQTEDAGAIMDKAYANGDLQAIKKATLPVDYYGNVMAAYIIALRDAGRADWRTVQEAFVEDLFSKELTHAVYFATWVNFAMADLNKAGHLAEAERLCDRLTQWFEDNPQVATPSGFQSVGWPSVFRADEAEPPFLFGIALRTGRYEGYYAYLRADLDDNCAATDEAAGKLDSALVHRQASLHWIRMQNERAYLWLVQLRLARLHAIRGDDNLASQRLGLALRVFELSATGKDASSAMCPELAFVLDGEPLSTEDVLDKFRSSPAIKKTMDGLECSNLPQA
ncbi:MAG: hypothetical protein AAF687_03160 [Pseudomonadota bacterium]